MRTADVFAWLSLAACTSSGGVSTALDAGRDADDACKLHGLVCADGGCPAGFGMFAVGGLGGCGRAGCCEPCPPPDVLSGALCISAGQAQCDQRGGVCASQDGGDCPAGYAPGGGACGDGARVPFAPCCLPSKDGG